jgi:hypothetical protein
MSNVIDYILDVLATSPEEINRIATRLEQPSSELLDWVAKGGNRKPDEIAQSLAELVRFEPVRDLFYLGDAFNKARRFENSCKTRFASIVKSHVFEIATEFPNAVFLLEYRDMHASYSGKMVIRAGEIAKEIFDGDQQSQALDWVLPDIFSPFVAEWNEGLPFASLWAKWAQDSKAALSQLEENGSISSKEVSSKEVLGTLTELQSQ